MTASGGQISDNSLQLLEHSHGLLEIDNVDAVPGAENVRLHLRIPAAGLVTEVHSGLQQLFHRTLAHAYAPLVFPPLPSAPRWTLRHPQRKSDRVCILTKKWNRAAPPSRRAAKLKSDLTTLRF
jgi:hypothetical protein